MCVCVCVCACVCVCVRACARMRVFVMHIVWPPPLSHTHLRTTHARHTLAHTTHTHARMHMRNTHTHTQQQQQQQKDSQIFTSILLKIQKVQSETSSTLKVQTTPPSSNPVKIHHLRTPIMYAPSKICNQCLVKCTPWTDQRLIIKTKTGIR